MAMYVYICIYVDVLNQHTKYLDPRLVYLEMVKIRVIKGQNSNMLISTV